MIHFKIEHKVIPGFNQGWGNGYVLIPKGHKYYGVHYDDIDVDVHGGLTYSEGIRKSFLERSDLTNNEIEQIDLDSWCIGFDTAHYEDDEYNCPESYVEQQCLYLKSQLETPKDLNEVVKQILNNG